MAIDLMVYQSLSGFLPQQLWRRIKGRTYLSGDEWRRQSWIDFFPVRLDPYC